MENPIKLVVNRKYFDAMTILRVFCAFAAVFSLFRFAAEQYLY